MRWLFALLLAATTAQAANIKVLRKESGADPAVISIDGKIEFVTWRRASAEYNVSKPAVAG